MTLKGTKTAQNLITSFAGESQATMRDITMQQKLQKKKVTNKSQQSLKKQQETKLNTLQDSTNS